jgi:hypothetical protein
MSIIVPTLWFIFAFLGWLFFLTFSLLITKGYR